MTVEELCTQASACLRTISENKWRLDEGLDLLSGQPMSNDDRTKVVAILIQLIDSIGAALNKLHFEVLPELTAEEPRVGEAIRMAADEVSTNVDLLRQDVERTVSQALLRKSA